MTLKFYINGVLTNSINTLSIIQNIINDNPTEIGAQVAPISGVVGCHDGKIDDIRIYNRSLTQEEVTTLYNE